MFLGISFHNFYQEVIGLLLLISPINTEEALEAIEGGADIVDVKNPVRDLSGPTFLGYPPGQGDDTR